jgi:hypothetical protein
LDEKSCIGNLPSAPIEHRPHCPAAFSCGVTAITFVADAQR